MINLKDAPVISIDIETHDPQLKSKGPGVRRDGYIVGVAMSNGVDSLYAPLAHRQGDNLSKRSFFAWLKKELRGYRGVITGANLLYDFDYLCHEGVDIRTARVEDVQVLEPLLDENARTYNLDRLGMKYTGRGKKDSAMVDKYGKDWIKKIREYHPDEVAPYAIEDVDLPIEIREKQLIQIEAENLQRVMDVECRLFHMLLYMRRIGVRIDLERAEKLSLELTKQQVMLQEKLDKMAGFEVNSDAAASIAKFFDAHKLDYPLTKKTKAPSFTKDFLSNHPHPFAQAISEIRRIHKMKGTFLDGHIFRSHINGRIHCEFNQLRGDEGGTVTGRFSSSKPNLQNIPSRDEELAPLLRGLFIPEEGKSFWQRDWSQIEFRLLVGYAEMCHENGYIPGIQAAVEAAEAFRTDPKTDYHEFVMGITGLQRKPAKNFNFGKIYGMGLAKTAAMMDMTEEEVKKLLVKYDAEVPFAKKMLNSFSDRASRRGYIVTALGRRRRFNTWGARDWKNRQKFPQDFRSPEAFDQYCEREIARILETINELAEQEDRVAARESIKDLQSAQARGAVRTHTHKALNAVIQGSAADIMKYSMVKIWEEGLLDYVDVQLTVHDELDGSVDTNDKKAMQALARLTEIMENSLVDMYAEFPVQENHKLNIPFIAEGGEGTDWGHCS